LPLLASGSAALHFADTFRDTGCIFTPFHCFAIITPILPLRRRSRHFLHADFAMPASHAMLLSATSCRQISRLFATPYFGCRASQPPDAMPPLLPPRFQRLRCRVMREAHFASAATRVDNAANIERQR